MKSVALLTNWGNKDGSVSKKQASACEESGSRKTEGDWRTGLELVARILVGESDLDSVARTLLCCSLPLCGRRQYLSEGGKSC